MTFLQQKIPQREKDHTEGAPTTVPARVPGSADRDRPVSQGEQVPRRAGESQEGEQAEGIARERGLCFMGSPAGRSGMQSQHGRGFGRSEGRNVGMVMGHGCTAPYTMRQALGMGQCSGSTMNCS